MRRNEQLKENKRSEESDFKEPKGLVQPSVHELPRNTNLENYIHLLHRLSLLRMSAYQKPSDLPPNHF